MIIWAVERFNLRQIEMETGPDRITSENACQKPAGNNRNNRNNRRL